MLCAMNPPLTPATTKQRIRALHSAAFIQAKRLLPASITLGGGASGGGGGASSAAAPAAAAAGGTPLSANGRGRGDRVFGIVGRKSSPSAAAAAGATAVAVGAGSAKSPPAAALGSGSAKRRVPEVVVLDLCDDDDEEGGGA